MESMSKIEGVLFDLDGTLLDSFPDFLASLENININSSPKKIDKSVAVSYTHLTLPTKLTV